MVKHGSTRHAASPDPRPRQQQQGARALDLPAGQHMGAVAQQPQPQPQPLRELAPSAMSPHEPSNLPPNGSTSPSPLLKVLQASAGSNVGAPQGDMQAGRRLPNGAAAPSKPAAQGTAPRGAAAAPGSAAAPAGAPQQLEAQPAQQTPVPTPAAQPTAATPAASPQQGPAAAQQAPAAAAASPGQQAAADLEGILARIMNLDAEGWFRHPVREVDAPNYYKIIKRPMCFEVMRSKIRGRTYVNWQEVVRDFELICSNAMKYNQRRSRVHKQALVMLRAGKKLLVEMEPEGRRAMAALVAAGGAAAGAASAQLTPADSHTLPSSLYRTGAGATGGATPASAGMLRSQSTADTATTEAESEPMQEDAPGGGATSAAEMEADPAGYSSYEETDLEGEEGQEDGQGAGTQQAAARQQLLEYARDAVLVQQQGAVGPAAGPAEPEQQAAADAAAAGGQRAHSREWKQVRRGVEWRARWLEHRLTELHRQRQRYQQELAAGAQREHAAAPQQTQQQQERQQPDGGGPRLAARRPHEPLPELQLPALLAHPFFGEHSVVGARQVATAGAALPTSPAAMDCDDFPAEAHAVLEQLDQRLSSLRRQLVALQKPAAQAALQRVQSVRVPGYRGGGGRRGGGYTPRGGVTPRGTPRSNSWLHRESSLAKRRRIQEYDVGELITPLGAPKFVERAQVKTIDTPRVRTLPGTELKKRQAAVEAYEAQLKQGNADGKAAAEAIDALCPGEGSSDEDTSDEAYLSRHQQMETEERARYEAVLAGAAVKKNKQQTKLGKERGKQPQQAQLPRPSVARAASAPALPSSIAAAGTADTPLAASLALPGAASAPAAALAAAASGGSRPSALAAPALPTTAATPSTAGTAAAAATPAGAGTAQQQQQQSGAGTAGGQQQGVQPPAGNAATKAASSAAASLTGPNGLPLVMIPMNAAMAAHMAQQMVAAAAAANQAGKQAGAAAGGSANAAAAAAAAVATSAAMLRPPFTLTPAMAAAMAAAGGGPLAAAAQQAAVRQAGAAMAAMAAAADSHSALPPALQAIIPPPMPSANGGTGTGSGSGRRGRPARNAGRPRR